MDFSRISSGILFRAPSEEPQKVLRYCLQGVPHRAHIKPSLKVPPGCPEIHPGAL